MRTLRALIAAFGIATLAVSGCSKQDDLETRMYGLIHNDEQAHAVVSKELAKLKTEGFKYFAVEETAENYNDLSDFISGRKTKENLLYRNREVVDRAPHIVDLLREAGNQGYVIVPIDPGCGGSNCYRDQEMFEMFSRQIPKGEKVVITVGGWHINEDDRTYPLDDQVHTPLGKFLREYTEGKNHTVFVYSTCIDEFTRSFIPRNVPHPDETMIVACNK